MKWFMCLITHTQYQLNLEIRIFTHYFWRLSVFLYVIKKAHVTAQVQILPERKTAYETWQYFMLQLRHLCTQLTFRTPGTHYFISLCIFSFQTLLLLYLKEVKLFFFAQILSTTFEMLKWEPLKWVLEKILNNAHHRYVTLKWIHSVIALKQLCFFLQPLILIFATVF